MQKRGANLKTIPAFKPLPAAGSAKSDSLSAADKLNSNSNSVPSDSSAWSGPHPPPSTNGSKEKPKKKVGRKPANSVLNLITPKASVLIHHIYNLMIIFNVLSCLVETQAGNSRDKIVSSVIVETPAQSSVALNHDESESKPCKSEVNPFADVLAGVGLVPGPRLSTPNESFSENLVKNLDTNKSNDLSADVKHENIKNLEKTGKKSETPGMVDTLAPLNVTEKNRCNRRKSHIRPMTPNSAGNDTESTLSNVSDSGIIADVADSTRPTVKIECPTENQSVIVCNSDVNQVNQTDDNVDKIVKESSLNVDHHSASQRTVSPIIITSAGASNPVRIEENVLLQVNIQYPRKVHENIFLLPTEMVLKTEN